jgi:hypothetical protein
MRYAAAVFVAQAESPSRNSIALLCDLPESLHSLGLVHLDALAKVVA